MDEEESVGLAKLRHSIPAERTPRIMAPREKRTCLFKKWKHSIGPKLYRSKGEWNSSPFLDRKLRATGKKYSKVTL